jgi:hypothetical protein
VAMLLDGQNYVGFESIAQNFSEFSETGFYFFADGEGDFVVPAGVFHVQESALLDLYRQRRAV